MINLRKMIFTLIMRKIFIRAPEITREMVTALAWFHILREVGAELKLSMWGPLTKQYECTSNSR